MTASRSEMDCKTPLERYQQLKAYLHEMTNKPEWSDEELVQVIRHDDIARRLTSLTMRPTTTLDHESHVYTTPLGQQLVKLWPALLQLPPPPSIQRFKLDISLIVPAYRERGVDVANKLRNALNTCQNPSKVQVIIVDAGSCTLLQEEINSLHEMNGENWRLSHSKMEEDEDPVSILVPVMHLEKSILFVIPTPHCHLNGMSRFKRLYPIQLQIHVPFPLELIRTGLNGDPYPPGIRAVEMTANIRTHLYSLPYGDQVLSVPAQRI